MESLKNKKEDRKALKWVYNNTKKFIPLIVLISLLTGIVSALGIFLALTSKDVLDIATKAKSGSLALSSVTLISIILFQILLNSLTTLLKDYTSGKLNIFYRNKIFSTISNKKYSEISKYHSGDLLNRITSDTDVVISGVINLIPSIVVMFVKIIGGMSTLIVLNAKVALISLAVGIFVPAIGRIISKKYKYLHKECQKTEGKVRSFVQESFENLVVIKTFEGQTPFLDKLNTFLRKNFMLKMKRSVLSMFTHLGLFSFFSVGYYIVLIWGAGQISKGLMTYGTLMAFLQLISQIRNPLQNVSAIFPQYYATMASAERIMEIESVTEDQRPKDNETLEKIANDFSYLEVNNVSFSYEDELILEDCSFVAQKGKITAITGESGSGKSTIFKIILGLYDVQKGNILINGNIKLDTSLRGLFAYVPQGNLVLSGTIRENLEFGKKGISEEQLIKVTKAAQIYDYIATLPNGFDTELLERGAGLSEGQIQRISIARALLTDAPILLFDEATSALDEATETKLLENIRSIEGKTVIFVTHRNTSLKICDTIIHCENKKLKVIK